VPLDPRTSSSAFTRSGAEGDYLNDDVRRYIGSLGRVASRYLAWPAGELLAALHEDVRGRQLTLPPTGRPPLDGPVASTTTSWITGAPWPVTPAAQREQWHRFPYAERGEASSKGADATGRYLTIVNVSDSGFEYPMELLAMMTSV
jgi:hypothetical protein